MNPSVPSSLFSSSVFLSVSLPPSPPCLSVACTGGPLGSGSQPVSWSPLPEQHMIFRDYRYCLCPSSRRPQARFAVDAWQKERMKLCKDEQGWAVLEFTSNDRPLSPS